MAVTARQKLLWFLIDGIGDVAVPELGHRTPLQAASTPSLDRIAANGWLGLMDPVEPGLACGSDTAHMSLFGYDPRKHYRGRGAFESMGAGLEMQPGDIAFKSNFATIDPATNVVLKRRADRNFEAVGPTLCAALDGLDLPSFPGYTVAVRYATEHRCGVRVRGPGLTDTIVGTDPLKDNLPLVKCVPSEDSTEARFTSQLINELSTRIYEILSVHKINQERAEQGMAVANCVLLRGCGSCLDVPSFEQLHGLKAFMIAPTCIIAGWGMTIHLDIIKVPGTTGDYHTNIEAKGTAAVEHILKNQYDMGFIHIKAVDDAGHDRNIDLKVKFLERIDRMIGNVMDQLNQHPNTIFNVCVTGDHSTPVLFGDHSHEPVPFAIARVSDILTPNDSTIRFDEICAAQGQLGRFTGDQVMPLIKHFLHS